MAELIINFETASPKNTVMLHIWEPAGDIRDVEGEQQADSRHFQFKVDMDTQDRRDLQFKFWYPEQAGEKWERDDFTRRFPTKDASVLWACEFSPRCLTKDPQGPSTHHIDFHVITNVKYAQGCIFAWNPSGSETECCEEIGRDEDTKVSHFAMTLKPWMSKGFHFKLVDRNWNYEPDWCNRVWRPSDGSEAWFKSGQLNPQPQMPSEQSPKIDLLWPKALTTAPQIEFADQVDDFKTTVTPDETVSFDKEFNRSRCTVSLYPSALYHLRANVEGWKNQLDLPLSVYPGETAPDLVAILGVPQWFDKLPKKDASLKVVIHKNNKSEFGSQILLDFHPGYAPRSRYDATTPVVYRSPAKQTGPSTWEAELKVFSEVPYWVDKLTSPDGMREARPDGDFMSLRNIKAEANTTTTLYTGDGITGFSRTSGPAFSDLQQNVRKQLMSAAFGQAIVDSGMPSPQEMPQGATIHGDKVWFVLYAPHAVHADLLLLDPKSRPNKKRTVTTHAMSLTEDLRYHWCSLPKTSFSDMKNIRYRYLLNGEQEVVDPASREVTEADFLWADADEGAEAAWSVVKDIGSLSKHFEGAKWQTPDWAYMLIYEFHPLRLTREHRDPVTNEPLPAFRQIMAELEEGGYLKNLGVTELEMLPINEFPKNISWGYNPAIPFAIESSYGGADDFAACVRKSQDAGKGVMVDVVFNHLNDSPLQAIAPDVYVDGLTQWGDMVNYDHEMSIEYFRQGLLHLWRTFSLDGFRLDATEAIINGHVNNGYIVKDGKVGSGKGFEFLVHLNRTLQWAATAEGRPWPYMVAENDPNNWGADGSAVDGQWDFDLQYPLGEAATNTDDKAIRIKDVLNHHCQLHETVRYAESHDAVSFQEGWKKRIVAREAFGHGMRMAKAAGTIALMAKGIPMLFMGEEGGETHPFYFSMSDLGDADRYMHLSKYRDPWTENNKIFNWFNNLMGLRENWTNGLLHNDDPFVGYGNKTVSFTRADGRFFVIVTMGTPDTSQNLGWLGLPSGKAYKEIFNSSWPVFQVDNEAEHTNGSYGASLTSWNEVALPEIGAVVLEQR